jgi:subtilisin family serine protease
VTLIAAAGNEHTDFDRPTSDAQSPNYPPNIAYDRRIDTSCLVMPTEGAGVLSVGAVGPSRTKADYSNWGLEHIDVAAPGGYLRDLAGTPEHRTVATQILAPYPAELAIANGDVDETGAPRTPFVVRDCQGETCAYYQYLQGTSMAAPHAAGVAALIVSRHGKPDARRGGLTLEPRVTERILRDSATHRPCPAPPVLDYTSVGRPASYRARCVARPGRNSIWGHGIVDALAAVR